MTTFPIFGSPVVGGVSYQPPTAAWWCSSLGHSAVRSPHDGGGTDTPGHDQPNEATWDDLQAVFGTRGDPSRCQCQRFKMWPGESWASVGAEELAFRLRTQTDCGHPQSASTSGLVAHLDDQPVGWCAVEPRTAYPRLLRNNRVPWAGRTEDKNDESVWAVTCFVTRKGFRRRGISYALARAAVDFARQRGAHALEGYPITRTDVLLGELHVGTQGMFAAAGFTEDSRPTLRRVVMRIDF